jgi:hypothetical protein
MIVSYACTLYVSLAPALALANVVSYDHKWCSKLWRHLWSSFMIVTYNCNSFIIQATVGQSTGLELIHWLNVMHQCRANVCRLNVFWLLVCLSNGCPTNICCLINQMYVGQISVDQMSFCFMPIGQKCVCQMSDG